MIRLQTYHIVCASGAKLKNGGDIKMTDLWRLKSDDREDSGGSIPAWAATSIEFRKEIIEKLKKQNDTP